MVLHIDSIKGFITTVIGLLASAIILFSLIGVEVRQHRQAQVHQALVYTQNFFAGIISAGLYILVAVLLFIYMISLQVSPFGPADRRKIECTSIVFRVTNFAILLLGGAAVYSTIEGWTLMDALYFTDYTLLTIGLGNLVPQTHLGRSLLFPYATLGITSLGLVITAVTSFTDQMRELKLKCKIEETRREIDNADSGKTTDGKSTGEGAQSQTSLIRSRVPKLEDILKVRNAQFAFYRRRRWAELGLFLAAWFVLWLVSAGVFRHSEKEDNWTYFVALYFTYTSLTTIGYGDYYPTSNFGKVFFIFWSLLAIPILTNLVTVIGNIFHIWLILCSGWIRRHVFRRGHTREHHHHEYMFRSCNTSGFMETKKLPKPGSRDPGLSIESRAQSYLETRESLPSAQVGFERSNSVEDEQHQIMSRRASTHNHLLLSEEIGNIISMMRDDSLDHQEELCCKWSRIIPMLQAKGDAGNFSELMPLFVSVQSDQMTMGMLKASKKELSERNRETLWMLTMLVEKLSSDLRKELSETI